MNIRETDIEELLWPRDDTKRKVICCFRANVMKLKKRNKGKDIVQQVVDDRDSRPFSF
jgi:hypothetical protein